MVTETIDSILNQTFKGFELIIVDNDSTDNTEEVIKSYKDERIRYFKHQNNGVVAVNRNYGINKARGEYIAFCDDDDLWFPEKLEKQVQEMEKDGQIGLICSNGINFDRYGEHEELLRTTLKDSNFTFGSLIWGNSIICCSALVKRQVIDDVGMMDESPEIFGGEDYELWLRVAKKYKVRYINLPLIKYRTHPGAYRKRALNGLERKKLIYKKLLDKGVLSFKLYRKRINKLNRQALLLKFLIRTGTLKYALFILRLLHSLKKQRTRNISV